jgi:methionyl-tRNA formyltransferase
MLEETLIGLKEGTICPTKQCEDGLCMANKLTKEECKIDWTNSNVSIHNLVRGVCRCPSAYFYHNDKLIKVIETLPVSGKMNAGEFSVTSKEGVDVGCGEGVLRLLKVKPEGKGEMNARDWYNGVRK